jgi:hypothetical protein
MKRYLLKLSLLVLVLSGSFELAAQDFDLKLVKADTILTPGSSCNIELSISGGVGPYTYMLYDNEPWEAGKLIEKTSETNERSHSFTILSAGRFIIAVRDKNDLTKMIIVHIKLAGTASIIQNLNIPGRMYLI